MSIIKIIFCIVLVLIGLYAFLCGQELRDLKRTVPKEEKKALYRLEWIAVLLPLIVFGFIAAPYI